MCDHHRSRTVLKLTARSSPSHETLIRVEGRLDAASLEDFRVMVAPSSAAALRIDLAGLTSLDATARDFLVGLQAAGCRFEGASLYINRLIEEA
jgi:hypothetical protein